MKRTTRTSKGLRRLAGIVSLLSLSITHSMTQAGDSGLPSMGATKSSFRFQGTLEEPTEGLEYAADFIFRLYDLPEGGKQIGPSVQKTSILVSDGSFITTIDFGDLSSSMTTFSEVWLQVEVRRPGEIDGFSPLRPRHRIAVTQPRITTFTPTQLLGTRPLDGFFGPHKGLGLLGRFSGGVPGTLQTGSPFQQTQPDVFPTWQLRGATQSVSQSSSANETLSRVSTSLTPNRSAVYTQTPTATTVLSNPVLIPATSYSKGQPFQQDFKPDLTSFQQPSRINVPTDLVGHQPPQMKAPPAYFNGRVLLDEGGEAWVLLPEQVPSLYKDPTYHLTAIGRPAPMLHVSSRERDGRFKISGGSPGLEVSWVVMGTRHDTWGSHTSDFASISTSPAPDDRILAPILFETSPSAQPNQTSHAPSNAAISRRRGKGPMITEVVDLGD